MTALRATFVIVAAAALSACAPMPARDGEAAHADAPERQILVMLHAAPLHFRPDTAYASGYDAHTRRGGQRRIAEAIATRHGLEVVAAWPMPALGLDCFVLQAPGRESIARTVDDIARDARVESVQAMNTFEVLQHNDPLYPLQPGGELWHLAEIHRVATGKGVRVAEIDTAVDVDHPDLAGRVTLSRDFMDAPPSAAEAHGTAVAGIIAARSDDRIGIAGVAPDAQLYALRACRQPADRPTGICTTFTLAKALQFALDRSAQVINMSLGGPRDRLLERLLDAALARRVVVVAAADPRIDGGGFPAAHPGVLAAAAESAMRLPAKTLLAPGRDVPTTAPGNSWSFVTGSSFAAAHVSGVVALLLERAPAMDAAEIRDALAAEGRARAVAGGPVSINACTAIARTTSACVCGCVVARDADSSRAR